MASLVPNNGLRRIGVQASQASPAPGDGGPVYSVSRQIQVMAVDNRATAFVAGDTNLGNPTSEYDQAFDANFPARLNNTQSVAHAMTIPTGQGNFTITRVSMHDDTTTNVTPTSNTLVSGIDGQSLTKTSDFTLKITNNLNYTSV